MARRLEGKPSAVPATDLVSGELIEPRYAPEQAGAEAGSRELIKAIRGLR